MRFPGAGPGDNGLLYRAVTPCSGSRIKTPCRVKEIMRDFLEECSTPRAEDISSRTGKDHVE